MNMNNTRTAQVTLLVLLGSSPAFGAGFQINEHSARATGRGSSVVATVDDPSAIWHNPAGLAEIDSLEIMLGTNVVIPDNGYNGPGFPTTNPSFPEDPGDQTLDSSPTLVPYIFAAYPLSEKAVVGVGLYFPYGLGTFWEPDDNFIGRTQADETELRTFFTTPTVALKPVDWLNVAVGLQLVPATLRLSQALGTDDGNLAFPSPTGDPLDEGRFELGASAFGVGATAGIIVRPPFDPIRNLHFGFNYRSAVTLNFNDGDADFSIPSNVPSTIAAAFPDQTGSGSVTLPHTFSMGLGWKEGTFWALEAGVQVTLWQSFDELAVDFDNPATPDVAEPRDWNAVPLIRIGGEIFPIKPLAVRAGFVFDVTPQPDETVEPGLPDGTRFNFSVGLGYTFFKRFTLDVAYLGINLDDRTIPDDSVFPLEGEFEGGYINFISTALTVRI